MMLMLTVDKMAQRYGLLPTEVLDRATTLDLAILDVSERYQQYITKKHQGKLTLNQPNLSQDEMKSMIAAVKGKKK